MKDIKEIIEMLVPVAMAYIIYLQKRNHKETKETKKIVNGRMDQMLEDREKIGWQKGVNEVRFKSQSNPR